MDKAGLDEERSMVTGQQPTHAKRRGRPPRSHPEIEKQIDQVAALLADGQSHAAQEISALLGKTKSGDYRSVDAFLAAAETRGLLCWQDNNEIGLLEDKRMSIHQPEPAPAKNGAHPLTTLADVVAAIELTDPVAADPMPVPHVEQPAEPAIEQVEIDALERQVLEALARERQWREEVQYLARLAGETAFGKQARLNAITARLQALLTNDTL